MLLKRILKCKIHRRGVDQFISGYGSGAFSKAVMKCVFAFEFLGYMSNYYLVPELLRCMHIGSYIFLCE
jgi:hypothetical protein